MTLYASKDVGFFLIGPYNMLGATTKIEDSTTLKLSEALALGDTDEGWFSSGVKHNELTQEGWFDDSTGSMHEALVNLPVVALPMAFAPNGNVVSQLMVMFSSVYRVGYDVQLSVGEVSKANGVYGSYSEKEEGIVVAPLAARTTAGNTDTTYADLGAGGSNGGAAYLFCTSLTLGGFTNMIAALRHSTDHITFTDKTSMTALTDEGAERKTFTGTINRYVSLGWAYTGSGTGQTWTGCLGVYANPA